MERIIIALIMIFSVSGEIIIFDDFESYTDCTQADCGPYNIDNPFTQGPAGWTSAQALNINNHIGGSTISIETSIPGYSSTFPGINSSQVFRIKQPNRDYGTNDGIHYFGSDRNALPAEVWFQFWIYINGHTSEPSVVQSRFKFIYPSINGEPTNHPLWLISASTSSYQNQHCDIDGSSGIYFVNTDQAVTGRPLYQGVPDWDNSWRIGPNINTNCANNDGAILTNEWVLVKIHIDTSSTSGGSQEIWLKRMGEDVVKISEWIHGTTPQFSWNGFDEGGHYGFQLFSTNGWTDDGTSNYFYMDDFVMAEYENDLPVYSNDANETTCSPIHAADTCDGVISLQELINHMDAWRNGQFTIQSIMEAIVIWKG